MLYLRATPCPSCGRGPLTAPSSDEPSDGPVAQPAAHAVDKDHVRIDAVCAGCSATSSWTFVIRAKPDRHSHDDDGITDQPSSLLDVGQWIMLSSLLVQDAQRERDNVRSRNLKIEAGACLEEALRFYDDDENDLPPMTAIFTDTTRERFRQAPGQFSRRRLIETRAKLPKPHPRTQGRG